MKQQYINSKVFGQLMNLGGQSLVGVYAMLLSGRGGYHCYLPQKNSNNKITSGKRLISKQSGISLTALNSHLPKLIKLGLCSYMKNGGFILLGDKKIKHKYNSYKKVPIKIGKNLRETKGNINAILIIANLYRQTKQIDKKITLNKALRKQAKDIILTQKEYKLVLNASKNKNIDLDNLTKVENIVLSNQGFSNLIRGVKGEDNKHSVSHGGYWRKVLQKRGFVFSRRRYKTIWNEKISYERFLSMKSYFNDQHGFVTYKNGRVSKPIVSEVFLPNLPIINYNIYNTNYIINNYNKFSGVEETPLALS